MVSGVTTLRLINLPEKHLVAYMDLIVVTNNIKKSYLSFLVMLIPWCLAIVRSTILIVVLGDYLYQPVNLKKRLKVVLAHPWQL